MDLNKIKMAVEKANVNAGTSNMSEKVDLSGIETIVSDDNANATPEKNATDIDMIGAGMFMLRDYMYDMNMKIEYLMEKLGMTNEEISKFYEGEEGNEMPEGEVDENGNSVKIEIEKGMEK
jgi:hypothetical protein